MFVNDYGNSRGFYQGQGEELGKLVNYWTLGLEGGLGPTPLLAINGPLLQGGMLENLFTGF